MAASTQHCYLLEILAELRVIIYNHYFDLPSLDPNVNSVQEAVEVCSKDKQNRKARSGLGCTSRQILEETLPIYLKHYKSQFGMWRAAANEARRKFHPSPGGVRIYRYKLILSPFRVAMYRSEMELAVWEGIESMILKKGSLMDKLTRKDREDVKKDAIMTMMTDILVWLHRRREYYHPLDEDMAKYTSVIKEERVAGGMR
jgi:hypothetical protein